MKKRAVSSLLASLAVVSFILPALAADAPGLEEMPPIVEETVEQAPFQLDGIPQQSLVYENRSGVTYVTVGSFVSMLDPEAAVEEENGAVTVNAARVSQVVDGSGNTATVVEETLNLTVKAGAPYIVANGRYLYMPQGTRSLGGTIQVPSRVLAAALGANVSWDPVGQDVVFTAGMGPITSGSAAEKAGLEAGDIITKVNGIEIGRAGTLSTLIGEFAPGDTVQLTVIRDGKEHTINLTLDAYKN